MKYKILKNTDLQLSDICLGTASFGEHLNRQQSFELLDDFVREGGNFLDTANVYCRWEPGLRNCSEQIIGEWLKSRGAYKNMVIATKGAHYLFGGEEHISRVNEREIRKDLENSLETLGVDVIDFYWLHRDDQNKSIEEIVDIMEKLKKEGKIRYYGFSNYQLYRLKKAEKYVQSRKLCGICGVSNQWSMASINPHGNMNPDPTLVELHEEEYLWHKETGTPVIPFSATASGWFEKMKRAGMQVKNGEVLQIEKPELLSEAMKKAFWNEENLKKYEKLLELQRETGYSLQALSISWLLQQPFQVFPVCGARNTSQLKEIMKASHISLTLEDFYG